MKFSKLYEIVEALPSPPVTFEFLRREIVQNHQEIGRVDVISVAYPEPNKQAYFRLGENDRTSAYEEEFGVAEIIHCEELALEHNEYRFALVKELMHIFDAEAARVDTKEKFIQLLRDIQNKPLAADASPAYLSEVDARWMACLVLCPKKFRDEYIGPYKAKEIQDVDIAEIFSIPEWAVAFVMDDYYDVVLKKLMKR